MDLISTILNEPKPLSTQQRNAVTCDASHIRIIAGAGAGKTETLTRRIVYLLLVKEVEPSSIVAFTFTEKAAESMKSRVYERVKHLGGKEVCARLGEMFIGTIHGYCARLLEQHFGHGDYGVLDDKQEMAYLMRVGWSLGLGNGGYYSTNCEIFLNTLNVYYGEMIPIETIGKHNPEFLKQVETYEEKLKQHKQLTFNLMVQCALDNLELHPEVADRVDFLIVDEYQDINRAQEKLIKLIGAGGDVFIVGDPRQTVYQWRGSDENCFEEFAIINKDVKTIRITENRRSTDAVINLANDFSDTFSKKKYAHMTPMRAEKGASYVVELEDAHEEVFWIADAIQDLVNSGKCRYMDLALLFRSVSTSAPLFIDEFRRREIPFLVGGKVGLFRRSEILALGKLFAWLYEGGFWKKDKWSSESVSGDELFYEAVNNWNSAIHDFPIDDDRVDSLHLWKESVLGSAYDNFTIIFQELLVILGYHNFNPDDPRHAIIMANMGRFNNLLTDFETANMLGGKKRRNWKSELNDLCWYMNTFASSKYEEQTGDDVGGLDAVQLLTVHQSKGLEWPLVFVPALVKRRFPSSMIGRSRDWLIERSLFDVDKYEGDIESERKLFYVALTRARDVVVCSYFSRGAKRRVSASEFVDDVTESDFVQVLSKTEGLPDYPYSSPSVSDELRTFTAGEIVTYHRCPHMYRLNRVWGYQPGLNVFLGYGKSLHFCLREAAHLIKEDGLPPMTAVATAVDENFHMPFILPGKMVKMKAAAKAHLMKFTWKFSDDMLRIKEVESRIEFPVQNAIVVGKVDVILHNTGNDDGADPDIGDCIVDSSGCGVEVREYKTSDMVISEEDVALQVRLYARGL